MNNNNEAVKGIYIITDIHRRRTQAGVNYVTALLTCKSERIKCVIWDENAIDPEKADGGFVLVSGTVGDYRGEKQITVDMMLPLGPEVEFDRSQVVPTAPIDRDACFADVQKKISEMQDRDLRSLCSAVLSCLGYRLKELPAAKSIHHAFIGGLLMHIHSMLKIAETVCDLYATMPGREEAIDRDLLYAGVILHDIGKVSEFQWYPCGIISGYTAEGRQFGHSVLGVGIIENICRTEKINPMDKVSQLKHLLLSHHGTYEYGAAALPLTLEAVILAQIDSLDAKTESAMEALLNVPRGSYTEKLLAFDGRQLYKPLTFEEMVG